jgi:hypothetical protein
LHRDWFKTSAMADLLSEDDSIAAKDTLCCCLDNLCGHKPDLFSLRSVLSAAPLLSGRLQASLLHDIRFV